MSDAPRRIGRSAWTVIHSFPYTIAHNDGDVYERILKYILLVELMFDLYPCHKCRNHIQKLRSIEFTGLCSSIARRNDSILKCECDARASIEAIALWAFRLHNTVTRHVKKDDDDVDKNTMFLHLEESATDAEIVQVLDGLYNIVY
jgi:hypothetical protein